MTLIYPLQLILIFVFCAYILYREYRWVRGRVSWVLDWWYCGLSDVDLFEPTYELPFRVGLLSVYVSLVSMVPLVVMFCYWYGYLLDGPGLTKTLLFMVVSVSALVYCFEFILFGVVIKELVTRVYVIYAIEDGHAVAVLHFVWLAICCWVLFWL